MTAPLPRKAKGERPYFFDDPAVDKLVAMIMGLAGEVGVLHDRLDTVERLLETRGLVKRREIEAYVPNAAAAAERAAWRETLLGEVLRIVEAELEGLARGDTAPYADAIAAVDGSRRRER
jgi:hypothetical protein